MAGRFSIPVSMIKCIMDRARLGNHTEPSKFRHLHINMSSSLLPILRTLSMAATPPASFCYPKLPRITSSIHPTEPLSTTVPADTSSFGQRHPSRHAVLVLFLYVSKPSQHSLIHFNRQHSFYSSYSTHLFIHESIYSNNSIPNFSIKLLPFYSHHFPFLWFSHHIQRTAWVEIPPSTGTI